jgi:hypothetical protein
MPATLGPSPRLLVPRFSPWPLCLLAVTAAALACQKQAERASAPPPVPSASGGAAGGVGVGGGGGAGGAAGQDGAEGADGGADAGGGPSPEQGAWLETASYFFRMDEIKRCGSIPLPPPEGKAAASAGLPKEMAWVGALVRVRASMQLFVSPRDVTLEKGGVIINPIYVDLPPLPACTPALPVKTLRAGQVARGYVFYKVPQGFADGPGVGKLAYQPTRWGGARRVEVTLQPCLHECPETRIKEKGKGGASPRSKRP